MTGKFEIDGDVCAEPRTDVLMMATAATLVVKADHAVARPYQRTELWLLLSPEERPRAEFAQQLIGRCLSEVYQRFATYFWLGGVLCFLGSVVLPA